MQAAAGVDRRRGGDRRGRRREADQARAFVATAGQDLGGLDVLVTARAGLPQAFSSTDLEDYEQALSLNLLSTIAMRRRVSPACKSRGGGRVIGMHLARRSGADPDADRLEHRPGGRRLLKNLATGGGRRHVTVNSVQPGLHAHRSNETASR